MAQKYRVISGDSHLDLAPERWTHRVPARWRERAPRTVRMEDGGEAIIVENRPPRRTDAISITGIPYEQFGLQEKALAGPGTGSPEQRVKEQDIDGVDAEILYTHSAYQNLWRGIADDEPYKAVIRAYNEWLAEEYCSVSPDRLIAMGQIPDTGIEDAIEEMKYCAKAGLKGIGLAYFPSGKGYPTPEDDRFWAAALDLNMPLTVHTAGGTTRFSRAGLVFQYKRTPKGAGPGRDDPVSQLVRFVGDASLAPMQMIMAGVFDRFPKLRIYWAETQIGWLPFALSQLDDTFERLRYLIERLWGLGPPRERPSVYLRTNCLWGFMRDPVGVRLRHDVGVNQLLWSNDFAHAAGDWPHSRRVIEETFAGVPEDERYRMLAGNAVDFFHSEGNKTDQ